MHTTPIIENLPQGETFPNGESQRVHGAACFDSASEALDAERYAQMSGGEVYTWQSGEGGYNRLRKGVFPIDVLCLAVLPSGLPETIDLPDDEDDES